jgi:hypothetical protein
MLTDHKIEINDFLSTFKDYSIFVDKNGGKWVRIETEAGDNVEFSLKFIDDLFEDIDECAL